MCEENEGLWYLVGVYFVLLLLIGLGWFITDQLYDAQNLEESITMRCEARGMKYYAQDDVEKIGYCVDSINDIHPISPK